MQRAKWAVVVLFGLLFLSHPPLLAALAGEPPLLPILAQELERNFKGLKKQKGAPLYFLAYRAEEDETRNLVASHGALLADETKRERHFSVEARVGSYRFDNTRPMRENFSYDAPPGALTLPLDDDPLTIQRTLWLETDRQYKAAQQRLLRLTANQQVKVRETDDSPDFSPQPPRRLVSSAPPLPELSAWQERLRRLSARFEKHPALLNSTVQMEAIGLRRYWVSSEGARLSEGQLRLSLLLSASARAADGMDLNLFERLNVSGSGDEDETRAAAKIEEMSRHLQALLAAPVAEPYLGPAIIDNRAAAVFFHEVLGHRLEGNRLKSEEEGQTLKAKVGQAILPDFLSLSDDPTRAQFAGQPLFGHYLFDDEGVPAQRTRLVERGQLLGFLMSRSPIAHFPQSNGHGRALLGQWPASRQGNLIVEAAGGLPYAKLRQALIAEVIRQGKPYGIAVHDISGGFTNTGRYDPNAFKVVPLLLSRIYADGRPDEWIRGADFIGTPLASLRRILAAGDDPALFNGICGAESGFLPVTAISPSLLFAELEVQKKPKSQQKPPLLPPPAPLAPPPAEPLTKALHDELQRTSRQLALPGSRPPYYVGYQVDDKWSFSAAASLGALVARETERDRAGHIDLRVGSYALDNSFFSGGAYSTYGSAASEVMLPLDDHYLALRHTLWQQSDAAYKKGLEDLAAKQAFLKEKAEKEDRPPSFSREKAQRHLTPAQRLSYAPQEMDNLVAQLRQASAALRTASPALVSELILDTFRYNRRLMNSEGFAALKGDDLFDLTIYLQATHPDGSRLYDHQPYLGRGLARFPEAAALARAGREMAERLQAMSKAPKPEPYSGPVLFVGEAAGELLYQSLIRGIERPQAIVGESPSASEPERRAWLRDKIGRRVLPPYLHLIDDPTRREYQGEPLLGFYPVDDDGLAPQPLTLIDKGILKTLYMSRQPAKELRQSNAHSRSGEGRMGNAFLESDKALPLAELKKKLLELAAEEGLDSALVVYRLAEPSRLLSHFQSLRQNMQVLRTFGSPDRLTLTPPLLLTRLDRKSGQETWLRGYAFDTINPSLLRDIVAVSQERITYQRRLFDGGEVFRYACPSCEAPPYGTLVVPSLLLRRMDLLPQRGETEKPPLLPPPPL